MNSPTSTHDESQPESGATPDVALLKPFPPAVAAGAAPAHAPPPSGAGSRIASGWALLLAAVALGISGFALWQANAWRTQGYALREEVAVWLKGNKDEVSLSGELAKQERERLDAVLGRLGALEGQVSKNEGRAVALEDLYQQFLRTREEHVIAEVQQAVAVAGQQLQYAGNVEMALSALRAAQNLLEQNDRAQFASMREALKADIDRLSQQDALDIPRTAQRLERVLGKIDSLPLAYSGEISATGGATQPASETEGDASLSPAGFLRMLAADIWGELRSLVRFERLDTQTEPVLLAPEQSAFLRENVKIRLLTARLAMLARDGQSYAADLAQARIWIERFFDMRDPGVQEAVEGLQSLEAVQVGVKRYEPIESASAVLRFQTQTRGSNAAPSAKP